MIEKIKIYLSVLGGILGLLAGIFWAGWALVIWLEGGTLDSVLIRILMAAFCFERTASI